MAAALQLLVDLGLQAGLETHPEPGLDAPARRVGGGLRILPVVGEADHDLRMALRLHRAAHDAEAHDRPPVLADEARDDGVEGALARADLVVVARREPEGIAAALETDGGAGQPGARLETRVAGMEFRTRD